MSTVGEVIGRRDELDRLHALLGDLQAGRGRRLVVAGGAGIGKTTLLDHLVSATPAQVAVLRVAGVRSEAAIAFSGLSDLLGPVHGHLSRLPDRQAAALRSALALGPPTPGDRLAVCVATAGLLELAAADRPVLVVVDDALWLDASSIECVLYASRRTSGPMSVLLAGRPDDLAGSELAELPRLTVGPLDASSSRALLGRSPGLADDVADALTESAAGNPLALTELPVALTVGQRRGLEPLPDPLPLGARLQSVFAGRVAGLSDAARRAVLVSALHDGDDVTTVAAACSNVATNLGQLGAAEAAGILRLDHGRVRFRHPLIRAAVAAAAGPDERRAAHRALADALTGERRAMHLGSATIAPDERVALELEHAAVAAAAKRGFAWAATALESAARLSPDQGARARRLLSAGRTAAAAGQSDRALALLDAAAELPSSPALEASLQHLRGGVMVWMGQIQQAAELLTLAAHRVAPQRPALAARMMADAATARSGTSEYDTAEELAEQAVVLLGDADDPLARAHVLAVLAYALALRGRTTDSVRALASLDALTADLDPLVPGRTWLHVVDRTRVPTGDLTRAYGDAAALCVRAREAGAVTALAGALIVAADAAFRLGDWVVADEMSAEAVQVSSDAGQDVWHGMARAIRARLTAAQGLEPESREHIRVMAAIIAGTTITSGQRFVDGARGFLELGLGNVAAAVSALERVEQSARVSGVRELTIVPWVPDLVEGYLRVGRIEDARRLVGRVEIEATDGPPTACALVARCRGLVEDDYDEHFATALRLDDACPVPFERARTELAYGRRLHRHRRRAEARARLGEALSTFQALGAAAWVAMADEELVAAGSRRAPRTADHLTAQEERVAAEVARGASNGEIAATLFLAPKTVEFHLTRIHRKLGVGSRSQLVALLARGAGGTPAKQQP